MCCPLPSRLKWLPPGLDIDRRSLPSMGGRSCNVRASFYHIRLQCRFAPDLLKVLVRGIFWWWTSCSFLLLLFVSAVDSVAAEVLLLLLWWWWWWWWCVCCLLQAASASTCSSSACLVICSSSTPLLGLDSQLPHLHQLECKRRSPAKSKDGALSREKSRVRGKLSGATRINKAPWANHCTDKDCRQCQRR